MNHMSKARHQRTGGSAWKEQAGSADLARRVIQPRQEESSWPPKFEVRGGLRISSRRQGRDILVPEQGWVCPGCLSPWPTCWGLAEGW